MAEVKLMDHTNSIKNQQINISERVDIRHPEVRLCLLPSNQQIYISSIIANSFASDFQLLNSKNQTNLRKQARILLIEQSLSLGVYQHILFSAFFYLEKYLNQIAAQPVLDQFLSIACLVLARKYQKGTWPNLNSWGQKLNKKLEKQKIQVFEDQIIEALEFQLEPITRYTFMTDLLLRVNIDEKVLHFCSYLLQQSVFLTHVNTKQEMEIREFSEGQIGLSVVRLGCYFFKPEQLQKIPILELGYNMQRIHDCCSILFELVLNKKLSETRRIRHKYKKPKFMEVGKIQFFKLKRTGSEKETADQNEQEK